MEGFSTAGMSAASGGTAVFGATGVLPRIALMASVHSAETAANLAGFVSQATGLEVVSIPCPMAGPSARFRPTSPAASFQEARPAYLVWLHPVEENLAGQGISRWRS